MDEKNEGLEPRVDHYSGASQENVKIKKSFTPDLRKFLVWALITVGLLTAICCTAGYLVLRNQNVIAKLDYQVGASYFNEGKYDQSIREFTKAIQLDPKYVAAYVDRGVSYDRSGEYDQALADYSQAIQLDPKDALAYSNRGGVYYEKGMYDKGIADETQAIQLNPKYGLAYANRGLIYSKIEWFNAAIADYTKDIALGYADSCLYYNRGLTYWRLGMKEKAIQDLLLAQKIAQNDEMMQEVTSTLKQFQATATATP